MSGRRAKALRRAFIAEHGRAPEGAKFTKSAAHGPNFTFDAKGKRRPLRDTIKIAASRFGRALFQAKGLGPSGVAAPGELGGHEVVEMFTRKIHSVQITEPGEWRRWKKKHRRK